MQKCSGLVYRANVSLYRTKRDIVYSMRLYKLKRRSCPGCPKCDMIEDSLDLGDIRLHNVEKVKHGKLYTIEVCNKHTDWETGIVDNWDLEIVEYKENK